jgi:hypothetical protein
VAKLLQIKEAIKDFPDDMEAEFVLLDESNNEIKLELKSAYKKLDFDNETYKVNNKLVFVTELLNIK